MPTYPDSTAVAKLSNELANTVNDYLKKTKGMFVWAHKGGRSKAQELQTNLKNAKDDRAAVMNAIIPILKEQTKTLRPAIVAVLNKYVTFDTKDENQVVIEAAKLAAATLGETAGEMSPAQSEHQQTLNGLVRIAEGKSSTFKSKAENNQVEETKKAEKEESKRIFSNDLLRAGEGRYVMGGGAIPTNKERALAIRAVGRENPTPAEAISVLQKDETVKEQMDNGRARYLAQDIQKTFRPGQAIELRAGS